MHPARLNDIKQLLIGHLHGSLDAQNEERLLRWADESVANRELFARLNDPQELVRLLQVHQQAKNTITTRLAQRIPAMTTQPSRDSRHSIRFLNTAWFRYAAAVLLFIGLGSVFYFWNTQHEKNVAVIAPVRKTSVDVLPGSDKAMLTLADGRQIKLDSSANTLLKEKGINNQDALISYSPGSRENVNNTLSTPNGGQYKIKLPDGTMAWLNAASSITYPTLFNSKTREVKITGEVYFDVAKNAKQPFIVQTIADEITVLGTSFNVNSYTDEATVKTSLINGSVRINNRILQPGQAFADGKIIQTNISQDVAWKNGMFNFNGKDFPACMRQLERWYDIEIIYDGQIPKGKFMGEISRNLSLNDAIELLNGVVANFKLEGRTLHVLR